MADGREISKSGGIGELIFYINDTRDNLNRKPNVVFSAMRNEEEN